MIDGAKYEASVYAHGATAKCADHVPLHRLEGSFKRHGAHLPNRKGKVEASVGHAQKTPLKRMRFESLEETQAHLDRWEERWADKRIHGTTKR